MLSSLEVNPEWRTNYYSDAPNLMRHTTQSTVYLRSSVEGLLKIVHLLYGGFGILESGFACGSVRV